MIEVYLNDSNMSYEAAQVRFEDADLWAQQYCKTYKGCEVQDVADFSYTMDQVALFLFEDQKDANFFMLRWSR
jgi:hypothetical protein